jgi:hypothetical protein
MQPVYCTREDMFTYALPRGAVPNPGRQLASFLGSVAVLDNHDLAEGTAVSFKAIGSVGLPDPLTDATYYASPVDDSSFRIRDAVGGALVTVDNAVDVIIVSTPIPWDAALSWASRVIDDQLVAHRVALTAPYPELIVMTAAELAGGKLLARTGASSKTLGEVVDLAVKRLARWAKGVPMRGEDAPTTHTNLAAASTATHPDRNGWGRYGGLGDGGC